MVRDYKQEDAANKLRALSESAAKRNPSQQFAQRPASLGGVQDPTNRFRVKVKHVAGGTGGIVWYCATMDEALNSLKTWPDVVETHIVGILV